MRPKELTLHNIGPFSGEHRLSFDTLASIFLICGETGAGKTTLFDALSYAFYGKPLGGRASVTKNLRSHFADEAAVSEVSLSFYLGSDLYRINRRLPYTKKGNKNESPEEVMLELFSKNEWQNLSSTNKRDTDTAIKALIKLSEKEFSRIVLLPQGEFAQFLSANSTEKKETLTHLFPVKRYTQMMAAAKDHADTLKNEVNVIEKNLDALNTEFSFFDYEKNIQNIISDIEHIRTHHATVFDALKNKNTALEQEILLAEKRNEYAEVCEELTAYENQEIHIENLKNKIKKAQKAQPLTVHVQQLRELEASLQKAYTVITEKEAKIDSLNTVFETLQAEKPKIEEKIRQRDAMQTCIAALKKAVAVEKEIKAEEKEEAEMHAALSLYEKQTKELEAQLSEHEKKIKALAVDIDALDRRQNEYEKLQTRINLERKLVDTLKKQEQQKIFFNTHLQVEQDTEKTLAKIIRDAAVQAEQLDHLQKEKTAAEHQNQAAVLAEQLKDNTPCPVCGSLHHPAPAESAAISIFTIDERIFAAQRSLEHNLQQKETAQKKLAAEQTARQTYETQLHEYEAAVRDLAEQHYSLADTAFPRDVEAGATALAQTARKTEEAVRLFSLSRKALNTKTTLETGHARCRDEYTAVATKGTAVRHRLVEITAVLTEKRKQLTHTFSLLPRNMSTAADAESALEEAQNRLQELKLNINAYSTKTAETSQARERIGGELTAEKEYAQTQEIQYGEKKAALENACKAANFNTIAAVSEALCDESDITGWQNECNLFYERHSALRQKAAGLEKELAGTKPHSIDEIRTELDSLTEQYDEIQSRLEVLHAEKIRLEDQCRRYKTLTERLTEASKGAECAVALSNDLNGSNARKLQFDTWALSRFLEEVTVFANERLNRMSEGRYRLEVSNEQGTGNGYKGLDLEITDAYTGKRRPSATLSGGETFMASISLALGLADSIQARAGSIHIDSMFIDEGFGTLDEKALDNAVSILDEIRGNRMVGIISHVGELQNRIPQTIKIIKTAAGSRIVNEQ